MTPLNVQSFGHVFQVLIKLYDERTQSKPSKATFANNPLVRRKQKGQRSSSLETAELRVTCFVLLPLFPHLRRDRKTTLPLTLMTLELAPPPSPPCGVACLSAVLPWQEPAARRRPDGD